MQSILDAIDAEAVGWAQEFVKQRVAALKKKRAVASGELIDSFHFEAVKFATEEAASLLISFADSGRIIDMKSPNFARGAGNTLVESLVEWMENKNPDKFIEKWRVMHNENGIVQDRKKILRSIAWGIAINRSKGKFKRKKWWNSAKTAGIFNLINNIAAALPEKSAEEIIKNLNQING